MNRKNILISILIFVCCLLTACGDERKVEVVYNICSEAYRCDSAATGILANPVHFYMPENHNDMIITFVTTETFGFASNMSDALAGFSPTFGEQYTINTEVFDLVSLAMTATEIGLDVAVLQYSDKEDNIIRDIAEYISGYQAGYYYYSAYNNQNEILFEGQLPYGRTTLSLSKNVERVDIYSYVGTSPDKYFPNGTIPGTVAYEGATEIDADENSIDVSNIVRYEDLNIFDKAKEIGYEIYEMESYNGHTISFVLNDSTSILVSDKKMAETNIFLYGHPMKTDKDMYVSFLGAYYSDKKTDTRDANGKWVFSNKHKKELINLLEDYKTNGVMAFSNFYSDGSSYLDGEIKELVDSLGLIVKVATSSNLEMEYNFYFFDANGKLAWFSATYSEADIRPNEKAYSFNGWNNGNIIGIAFGRHQFKIDYVDQNNKLNVEQERLEQLKNFFIGKD